MAIIIVDGARVDVLHAAGADDADMIIYAADGQWLNRQTLAPVRAAFPHLSILARAFDRRHWLELRAADIGIVVRETFDSAVALGRGALAELGTDETTIDAIEEEFRRRDAERLAAQLCADGDMFAGRELFFRPGDPAFPAGVTIIPATDPDPDPA